MIKLFNPALDNVAISEKQTEEKNLHIYKELISQGELIPFEMIASHMNSKRVLVIEPHSDDGTFSAGGVLAKFFSEGSIITSLCIFSKQAAKEAIRKKEAERIYKDIFYGDVIFADFIDGFYRTGEDIKGNYMGEFNAVKKKITECIKQFQPDIVLGPLAIGDHVDHRIVNSVLMTYYKKERNFEIWFYEDYPYCWEDRERFLNTAFGLLKRGKMRLQYVDISRYLNNKTNLNMIYLSQHEETWESLNNKYKELAVTVGKEEGLFGSESKTGEFERYWVLR